MEYFPRLGGGGPPPTDRVVLGGGSTPAELAAVSRRRAFLGKKTFGRDTLLARVGQPSWREYAGIGEEGLSYVWECVTWAIRLDAISTWIAIGEGWPGTAALGLAVGTLTGS